MTISGSFRVSRFVSRNALLACLAPLTLLLIPLLDRLPACPLRQLTGFYCPGCGSARALHCLFEGDVLSAVAMNPLLPVVAVFTFWFLISYQRQDSGLFSSPIVCWTALAVVVLFTVARNLPWEPFRLLAPGAMLGH